MINIIFEDILKFTLATYYSLLRKIWDSPTFTTWGSFIATLLGWVLLLPFALNRLTTGEIALWYFFRIFNDLRPIVDAGFSPTFIRQIAYAFGGSEKFEDPVNTNPTANNPEVNWTAVENTFFTMEYIYVRLAGILLILLVTLGTLSAIRPISLTEKPVQSWIAWILVALTTSIYLRGNSYTSLLQGSNNIPLYRRWEALFSMAAIPTGVIVLLLGGGLLGLVATEQFWLVISVLRNRVLTKKICQFRINQKLKEQFSKDILNVIWPRSWRSGLGILMSFGVMQFSGLVYSQIGNTSEVAAYLLSLRFAQNISTFSRVPFYSRLPQMASLYASNFYEQLLTIAKRGMKISHWLFSLGFIGFGLIAPFALSAINSNTGFVPQSLWAILGLGFFAERYGAMHLQLYTLTNRVVWHIANGITGTITLIIAFVTLKSLGIYAFPVGYAAANIGFYAWYCARLSYKNFNINFLKHEFSSLILPLWIYLVYIATIFFINV